MTDETKEIIVLLMIAAIGLAIWGSILKLLFEIIGLFVW